MDNKWFEHAIIYHILIDRFAGFATLQDSGTARNAELPDPDKPVFCGGNLRGIIEKLQYIKDLGTDAIMLSPFNATTEYHGYHITDYFSVEPGFGTIEDLRELTSHAHAMGLRVIADFVPNHCSKEHPFFRAAQGAGEGTGIGADYRDWFFFTRWPDRYRAFFDFMDLPKINLDHPPARRYLIDSALYWMKQGIDGFRIDHVVGVSQDFLKQLCLEVKAVNPEAVLMGEAWITNPPFRFLPLLRLRKKYLRRFFARITQEAVQLEYAGLLDGALDFSARDLFIRHIAYKPERESDAHAFLEKLRKHNGKYPDNFFLPVFLDNHDTNRFLFECGNDIDRLKRALALLLGLDQAVILYYGTESGMTQQQPVKTGIPFSDLAARGKMNWNNTNKELLYYVKLLIMMRRERLMRE
ncbi:MAG: hypothetical protein EHM28_10415 [Spirochaetaceae bacterium]|nr:MAG: hypothetical protein EHM28_10415 [Spirochaetaceae bacterium]